MTEDFITSSHIPGDHPSIPKEKVGALLLNLGTPVGTDFWSIRRYLKEFLSDCVETLEEVAIALKEFSWSR